MSPFRFGHPFPVASFIRNMIIEAGHSCMTDEEADDLVDHIKKFGLFMKQTSIGFKTDHWNLLWPKKYNRRI